MKKGQSLSHTLLSADAFKKLNIVNAKAFLTYLGMATATALSVKAASRIHDKIVSKGNN